MPFPCPTYETPAKPPVEQGWLVVLVSTRCEKLLPAAPCEPCKETARPAVLHGGGIADEVVGLSDVMGDVVGAPVTLADGVPGVDGMLVCDGLLIDGEVGFPPADEPPLEHALPSRMTNVAEPSNPKVVRRDPRRRTAVGRAWVTRASLSSRCRPHPVCAKLSRSKPSDSMTKSSRAGARVGWRRSGQVVRSRRSSRTPSGLGSTVAT